jgi:hypothetical protein
LDKDCHLIGQAADGDCGRTMMGPATNDANLKWLVDLPANRIPLVLEVDVECFVRSG